MSLIVNGYSEANLLNSLKALNLPYSETELLKIKEQLREKLTLIKERELPKEVFTILIDEYHCEIKKSKKVEKATC